ncbi:MAG: histidine kinase dimerization/phospho-acceptor domain-containing protein [Pseudomonadota bacterium]|nr:histidine kinase dimerization/phospho-acceptor domain-containing protein [Pseudomonadota bacterium]
MFFDDRLATVLRQQGASEIGKRTQFRQLLDILGNRKFGPDGRRDPSLIAAAWLRMDALGRSIPAAERAAMIREPSWRFRSADLAAHLADFEPEVASAALNRAELTSDDWKTLIPRLPVRARGFLRLRNDLPVDAETLLDRLGVQDRGLPSPGPSPTVDPSVPVREADDPTEPDAQFDEDVAVPLTDMDTELEPVEIEPEALAALAQEPVQPDPIETGRSEISALVERIAQFKRSRETQDNDGLTDSDRSPRLPLNELQQTKVRQATNFGFATDASGRIDWSEAEVAPMVIGTKLIAPPLIGSPAGQSPLQRAMQQRQPVIHQPYTLAGAPAIAGEWVVDAQPRFTESGSFSGYVGRFRRVPDGDQDSVSPAAREADRIRQLLHELRTPVTAVQGYAEVIQQQLFGPAPHEYRALAAAIAADAAHILAGFEELDRLAQLETGAKRIEQGQVDLAELTRQTALQLGQVLSPRMAGLELEVAVDEPVLVGIDRDDAELIVWRLLATLGGGCGAGEMLAIALDLDEDKVQITCELPRQLLEEEDIFAAEVKPIGGAINAGLFGAGFALRLVKAEAQSAGGDLVLAGELIALTLPVFDPIAQGTDEADDLTRKDWPNSSTH